MEILLANAFYLYIKLTPSPKVKSMREFKECVIRNLLGKPKPKKHMVPQASFHHLAPIPPTEKKNNPCRCCKHCSSNGKRKETRYLCVRCPEQPPCVSTLAFESTIRSLVLMLRLNLLLRLMKSNRLDFIMSFVLLYLEKFHF